MAVHVFKEGTEYVASDDAALVHAFGDTKEEARANLADRLSKHHARLQILGPNRLAPHLKRALAYMDREGY